MSGMATKRTGVKMIEVRPGVNEFELVTVLGQLMQQGTHEATIQPGNGCVWVASGTSACPINQYWIFRKGQVVDIQTD
jgi:hypothetical protein